ncbi:unnamed protein product [Prorocentrum cordatum]|uniref:Uncharacterized protein n=1 Tax=Prorocentrum cordatum TaxID=2364126 RepID=A0ABN9TUN5_9DINO|nr:unnamed protein product [Polarella glacialis]
MIPRARPEDMKYFGGAPGTSEAGCWRSSRGRPRRTPTGYQAQLKAEEGCDPVKKTISKRSGGEIACSIIPCTSAAQRTCQTKTARRASPRTPRTGTVRARRRRRSARRWRWAPGPPTCCTTSRVAGALGAPRHFDILRIMLGAVARQPGGRHDASRERSRFVEEPKRGGILMSDLRESERWHFEVLSPIRRQRIRGHSLRI